MEIESKQQILERRKELEQELVDMLKETDPTSPRLRRGKEQFTLQDVRDAIFHEEDNDDMMKVVAMFDRGGDASRIEQRSRTGNRCLELLSAQSSRRYLPGRSIIRASQ